MLAVVEGILELKEKAEDILDEFAAKLREPAVEMIGRSKSSIAARVKFGQLRRKPVITLAKSYLDDRS